MHSASMICGCARVSTDAQDFPSQLAELEVAGCEKVFRERITGAKAMGVKFGPKSKHTERRPRKVRARVTAGETQRSVAQSYSLIQVTISRLAPEQVAHG